MWNKIKEQEYLTVIKYCILGLAIATLIYHFTLSSLTKHELDFSSLMEKTVFVHFIATLIGSLLSGYIFILATINNTARQANDKKLWLKIKDNSTLFFIQMMLALSIGGFTYVLSSNLFEIESFNEIISLPFYSESIDNYISTIIAFAVFSIFLSIGMKKRVILLFGKEN